MKTKFMITFAAALGFLLQSNAALAQTPVAGIQFSKIILYDIPADSVRAISVPSGKIWQIESISMGSSGSYPSVFMRNSAVQNIAFFASPPNTASANYPYWLPESFSGSFLNNSHSYRCSVSIIEYSITP